MPALFDTFYGTSLLNEDGSSTVIHVVPLTPPTVTARRIEVEEDKESPVQLIGVSGAGLCRMAVLTTLPQKGRLYTIATGHEATTQFDENNVVTEPGLLLDHPSSGNYLLYKPDLNGEGMNYDSFEFQFVLEADQARACAHVTPTTIHSPLNLSQPESLLTRILFRW